MKKNLVMSVAKGYGWYVLEPLVNSFKKNCPNAELVLFVADISDFTRDKLIREGVTLEPFTAKNTPVNARWKFFLEYLQTHEGEYEQVFLCDARDVIFQADVFAAFDDCKNWLGCVTEADDISGSKTGIRANYRWLVKFFGEDAADKLADRKIICGGTIIGSAAETKILLSEMSARLSDKTLWGQDQATLNYLAYNGLLPIENLFEIDVDDGAIFTVCLYGFQKTLEIRNGMILRGDGSVPAVVHQYDRREDLIRLVDETYHDKNFSFDPRFTDTRSLLEQCCGLLLVDKTAAATWLFLKVFFGTNDFAHSINLLPEIWKLALRKTFSRSIEILELATQKALFNVGVEKFSVDQLEAVQKVFVHAAKNNRAVNLKWKFSFANRLFEVVKFALERNSAEACFRYIDWLNQLDLPPDENYQRVVAEAERTFGRRG